MGSDKQDAFGFFTSRMDCKHVVMSTWDYTEDMIMLGRDVGQNDLSVE